MKSLKLQDDFRIHTNRKKKNGKKNTIPRMCGQCTLYTVCCTTSSIPFIYISHIKFPHRVKALRSIQFDIVCIHIGIHMGFILWKILMRILMNLSSLILCA